MSDNQIRQELFAYLRTLIPEPIRGNEFTILQYAEEMDVTRAAATAQLKTLVEKEILYKRKARVGDKNINVYGRIEDEPEP